MEFIKNQFILQWWMRTMLKLVKGLSSAYKKSQEPFTWWYALFPFLSVSGLLTDLAYILEYQKIRYINFKHTLMQWALKREDFFSIYSLLVNLSYLRIVFRYTASTDIKVPPHTLKWELAFKSGYWLSGYTLSIQWLREKITYWSG